MKEQMAKSLFYEWTLKQWWEKIYSCENDGSSSISNVVVISACVKRLVTLVYGMEAEKDQNREFDDGFIWFSAKESYRRKARVGLNLAVFEKLIWLQEKRGWGDDGDDVRVEGSKEISASETGWRRFGCYILVESFVLRKSDGSLVINFNFKNTDKIQCILE